MDRFIAQANIDHYLSLLKSADLSTANRATIIKLLVTEEDKLAHDLEHLEFAERRTANCRERVNHFRNMLGGLVHGSTDHAHADRMLAAAEETHRLMDQFCHHLHEKVSRRI